MGHRKSATKRPTASDPLELQIPWGWLGNIHPITAVVPRGGNEPPNEDQFNRLAPKLAHNYLDEYFHTGHKGSLSRYRPGHFLFDSEPDKDLLYDRDTATQRCRVRVEPCGEVFLASQYLRYFISRLSVSHLLYPMLGRRRVGRFHADSALIPCV